MSWMVPLGFLGLLGIAVLILLYVLKPNYQQKMVSSTFVWKLSLKYRRKKLPINRFRSLLILICQLLIITACAMILAQPFIKAEGAETKTEKIIVIDASANMLVARDSETRFERAVDSVKELTESILSSETGVMTVILAGTKAECLNDSETGFVARRVNFDEKTRLLEALDGLIVPGQLKCTYTAADIDGAMALAESVLAENPESEVLLYTGTTYVNKGDVTVVNVAQENEWNAAILDVSAKLEDNYYTFYVKVASYGIPVRFTLHCDINGANGGSEIYPMQTTVACDGTNEQEIVFKTVNDAPEGVDSYGYAFVYIEDIDDWYQYDNYSYVYGEKYSVKVQYYSSKPNSLMSAILMALRSEWSNWNIELTQVKEGGTPELSGYDFYIFEHVMPETIPTDGVVVLIDLNSAPSNSGITMGNVISSRDGFTLAAGENHPIMERVTAENIKVTTYTRILTYDGFTPLMYCGGDPVFLVKNEPAEKLVLFSIDVVNQSDFSVLYDFPQMMINMFNYFLPATITKESVENGITVMESERLFEVGQMVTLNARGEQLTVKFADGGNDKNETIVKEFPEKIVLFMPGTYTVTQQLLSGEKITESFYVKISADQSDIFREVDDLTVPVRVRIERETDYGLSVFVAAVLVALLFLEWWLQSRENF